MMIFSGASLSRHLSFLSILCRHQTLSWSSPRSCRSHGTKRPVSRARDITVDPAGGIFDSKTVAAALKKTSPDDGVLIPSGEHELSEVDKSLRIRAIENGAVLRGPMVVTGEFVIFSG